MNDLMYSDALKDQLNLTSDFNVVRVDFGNISGDLVSITDRNTGVNIEFHSENLEESLNLLGGIYPREVIIRYDQKQRNIELDVQRCSIVRESDKTLIRIEGDYVNKKT